MEPSEDRAIGKGIRSGRLTMSCCGWFHNFTTKSGGFGIGLYQVKGIVETRGGRIEVESGVGRGSSFRVYLPAAPGDPLDNPAWKA